MSGTPGYYTVIAFDCDGGFVSKGISDFSLQHIRKDRKLTDDEVETYREMLLDNKIAKLEAELENLYAQKKP